MPEALFDLDQSRREVQSTARALAEAVEAAAEGRADDDHPEGPLGVEERGGEEAPEPGEDQASARGEAGVGRGVDQRVQRFRRLRGLAVPLGSRSAAAYSGKPSSTARVPDSPRRFAPASCGAAGSRPG